LPVALLSVARRTVFQLLTISELYLSRN